jgi:Domain of unknown function (DUF4440)
MSTIDEIVALEERLRQAELGPDPAFFETIVADDAVIDGLRIKDKIVAAHRPGGGPKFTKLTISRMEIADYGTAAVVTCTGAYEGDDWSGTLNFVRVWHKRNRRWQIIAASIVK